jgi:hypothetical protein
MGRQYVVSLLGYATVDADKDSARTALATSTGKR